MKRILFLVFFLYCFLFCGFSTCTKNKRDENQTQVKNISKTSPTEAELIKLNAKKILDEMNLTEKLYQVLMLSVAGNKDIFVRAEKFKYPPGGIILFKFNFDKDPIAVYKFIKAYEKKFKDKVITNNFTKTFIPPFFATDNEGGKVFRTAELTSTLPYPNELTKNFPLAEAEKLFLFNAQQMNALGLSMNLAPICEYGNTQSSFLGKRIFSEAPKKVSAYTSSFVIAHRKENISCVLKHFPGSGNDDTHKGISKISGNYEELLTLCKSFRIPLKNSQVVMLSHAVAEVLDDLPFCLSKKGIDFLKSEFQYDGIIMSDDITMKALSPYAKNNIDLAYKMILAGCDLILYSATDFNNLVDGLVKKAEADANFVKRLNEAVEKILIAKLQNKLINEEKNADFDSVKFYSAKTEAEKLLNKNLK